MALVEFFDEESKGKGVRCLLDSGGKYSVFIGLGNEEYFLVNVLALHELDDRNIKYKLFDDPADANLRKDNMEVFRGFERQLNEDVLPPRGYVEVKFGISEPLEDFVGGILERYGSTQTKIEEGSIMLPGSEKSVKFSRIVSSYVPREKFKPLVEELARESIAGFDKAHQVICFDPDRKV